jgi:hypothetical protein
MLNVTVGARWEGSGTSIFKIEIQNENTITFFLHCSSHCDSSIVFRKTYCNNLNNENSGIAVKMSWFRYSHFSQSYIPLSTSLGLVAPRVGNFRQKNNSAEDGIDGTNGYFRRNSGCSAEQNFSEFRSEPFRGRENISEFRSAEQK